MVRQPAWEKNAFWTNVGLVIVILSIVSITLNLRDAGIITGNVIYWLYGGSALTLLATTYWIAKSLQRQ